MKARGEKIAVLTAYDATMARLLDTAGIDVLLVGDSLGMVVLGHETTLPVTLDAMIHHTAAVNRGARRALAPLTAASVANEAAQGAVASLTGPIVRGDVETIRRHIAALAADPEALAAYRALSLPAIELARSSGTEGGLLQ